MVLLQAEAKNYPNFACPSFDTTGIGKRHMPNRSDDTEVAITEKATTATTTLAVGRDLFGIVAASLDSLRLDRSRIREIEI